jgi:hypothetical protein
MNTTIGTAKYGMAYQQPAGADQSAAANGAVTSANSHVTRMSAENPAVWLVGIGAVTLGLVAFSTSVRVGKFAASASAGTP